MKVLLWFFCLILFSNEGIPQTKSAIEGIVTIKSPVSRIVFQRDRNNEAVVPVKGQFSSNIKAVRARLLPRTNGRGVSTNWQQMNFDKGGFFSGEITCRAGWYDLIIEIQPLKGRLKKLKVERVGVGEVFLIAGHSVAQGGDINGRGAGDDRVSTIAVDEKSRSFQQYLENGKPEYLPPLEFVRADSGVAHAPFGHGSYFWSEFGGCVARKWQVPVLIFNAAFGGTNLEHWAKSTKGEEFEHGFVKSKIRMPYINLFNAMRRYISVTGLRAILADHGQNDNQEKNEEVILSNYQTFVAASRQDLGWEQLAIVVNRQAPANAPAVRKAQELMLKDPYSYPGPDYDAGLSPEDRYDGIHLSASGVTKAAQLWCNALDSFFVNNSEPFVPGKGLNTIKLYSGAVPNSIHSADREFMENGVAVLKVSVPTLTAYLPKSKTDANPAVIICPGGGYGSLMMTYEGHDVARALSKKGIAAFVLKYRLPDGEIMKNRSAGALQDLFTAIKTVRDRHAEFRVDVSKVGVMGFSAGGHLAASAGILDNIETISDSIALKPDFMILVYPVITMDTTIGHRGSTINLLGENPSKDKIDQFSLELHVNKNTPPAFITVAADDDMLISSMLLFSAMKKNKLSSELHVFSDGGHGFLKYPTFSKWSQLFLDWMQHHGIIK